MRDFCVCDNNHSFVYWNDYAKTIDNDTIIPIKVKTTLADGGEHIDVTPAFIDAANRLNVEPDEIFLCSFDLDKFPEELFEETGGICPECGGWI